jgi:proteasome accessory factor C
MTKLDNLYRLHRILNGRRVGISRQSLMQQLGIGRSTLTRLIANLRDMLGAPIIYDGERGGYRYDSAESHHFDLPGLWFTADELLALLTLNQLLHNLQPGLLDEQLAPFRARLQKILSAEHLGASEAGHRIRILAMAARVKPLDHFQTVAGATLQRMRLRIRYYNREKDAETERHLSPQRIVHYRDNWYLDAWCHEKRSLRTFAIDAIRAAEVHNKPAKVIAEKQLDHHYSAAYGIFAGQPKATAVLRFTAQRARWVADETWHPRQQSRWLEYGRFELSIPYSHDTELIMDILKYGADVEVIAPDELKEAVKIQLDRARSQYG